MATLTLDINVGISGVLTGAQDLTTLREGIAIAELLALASGTASQQANEFWSDQRTLVSTSEDLDLYSSLINAFGDSIEFVTIRAILIKNKSTVTNADLILSGSWLELDPLAGTTPTIAVQPDGLFLLTSPVDGMTVTNTSADTLTIDSGSETITYNIVLVGTT